MRVLSQSCPFNSFLLIQCARVMPLKIFLWCSVLLQATFALTGDNVCRRVETSSETVQYVIQEPVTYRLYTWCLKMPPRCSKYSTIMKERIKSKIQINNNTIEECCEGHVELSGICVTECNSTECPNMLCKTEDSLVKCKCRSGFMGYKCNKPCLYGFWGEGCFDKCECNGESCDAATGDCLKTSPVTTTTTSQTSETPPTTNSKTNGLTSTSSQQKTSNSKIYKNDSSQEAYPDLSLDPTGMPPAVSQEEFPATLLPAPEDEIILLYPSPRAQTPSGLQKLRDTIVSTSSTTESSITSDSIPRPPKSEDTLEKLDDLVRHTLFTKDSEFGSKNENDLTERFPMKSTTDHESNQSTSRFPFNINQNGNTDSTTHSANQKYKYPDEWHKMENKHYQNKNDNDFDNNLQMSNGVQNYTDFNRNGLNTNEIQKDMGAHSEENLSSSDMTINSSLVKAKRQRGFDLLDFNSLLILLSLAATIILSFVLIIVSVVRCNRLKADASSSYDDTVNCENPIRTGHYSTPGQPIFFCPAFTNSYAIELAQELREAQYDHPKSACCLNEPLYAELKY